MLANNQILQGRYRITRQLGAGGMGTVYEAIDDRFGEPIALKEIIFDLANEKQREILSKAFEREAKSLAKSKHEAVPYVRDYFSELNRQFLVMELVEGEDLAEMLSNRGKPFPLEDILNWMDQLLDALDYLHNLKPPIIHRDIKPQNLKLNVRRRIKLLDFGIARSSDNTSATINKHTFVGATLNYSPIEQLLRVIDPTFRELLLLKHKEKAEAVLSQDTDPRCDIYALGGTFYHLLTNVVPIDATKRTLEIWEGQPDPLPNPSVLNPLIPISVS
ncbi:MAG TPA: serine/threonine-protein kinase, partial [Pyrinomonadaceae bacterium]|nr:serine/threonine-protein kinase [Pyrinomonadaceae bacterium]